MKTLPLLVLLPFYALSTHASHAGDLKTATAEINSALSSREFTRESCASTLSSFSKNSLVLDPKRPGRAKADAPEILKQLWSMKLALRGRLAEFQAEGVLPSACVKESRLFLNAGRTLEDYLGEQLLRPAAFDKKHPSPAFQGKFPSLMLNPSTGQQLTLRSGDVLLSRATAYTSAAISRIANVPAQFSHLSILYIDRAGRKWVVQSTIEHGANVIPYSEFELDGKARAVIYRHSDAQLAALAAKKIYDLITSHDASGNHIVYDFKMNLAEHSELFCTEVVAYAFDLAGKQLGRRISVPLHNSLITRKNRDFLERTGMNARISFMPADMEVDPRFEMVAEWRNFALTRKVRQYDAVLDKQFEWMERLDYVHAKQATTSFFKHLAYGLRHGPLSGLVDELLPENMPKSTLEVVLSLFLASGPMGKVIAKADSDFEKRAGLPMTEFYLKDAMERFRDYDYKQFKEFQEWERYGRFNSEGSGGVSPQPRFHHYFRPRKDL